MYLNASSSGQKKVAVSPKHTKDRKDRSKYKHKKQSASRMKKSHSSPSHIQLTTSSDEENEAEGLDAELHSLSIQVRHLG